jgi:hypothetical protein
MEFTNTVDTIMLKSNAEINELMVEAEETGYYIQCEQSLVSSDISTLGQRLSKINVSDETKIVLKLPIPIHYVGLVLEHSLLDLFDMMNKAHELELTTKYIELMLFDSIESHIHTNVVLNKNNNRQSFKNRLFSAGKNYSKVTDEVVRNQLLLLLNNHNNQNDQYPDQQNVNMYEFSLLYYCQQPFEHSCLNDGDSIFYIENLQTMITNLESINKINICAKIINSICVDPRLCDLLIDPKFRQHMTLHTKQKVFNYQLIKEQMIGTNIWKDGDISLWTLNQIQEIDNCRDFEWYFNQLPATYLRKTLVKKYNYLYRVPSNQIAISRFHKFTYGLLDFTDDDISEFYGDNLVIGGSTFAYSACTIRYNKTNGNVINTLSQFDDSDIDCAIMAGDGIILSQDELEVIVDQKLEILQRNFPTWTFTKSIKGCRFQIDNDHIQRTIDMYSVPYSPDTVWKHYSKYHFGWVRGYFNGTTWYVLPSGVIAVLTRMSIDIRYCAAKHAPQELIYKYMSRGFFPILNDKEYAQYKLYIKNVHNDESSEYDCNYWRSEINYTYHMFQTII